MTFDDLQTGDAAFVDANTADVAHRLMTVEAMGRLGWPAAGLAARLRKHHAEIPKLR